MEATSLSAASLSDNYRDDGAVFMICMNIKGPYAYEIYSIDFKSVRRGSSGSSIDSIPKHVKHLARDLYPISMGFFSIGSKIYMIGGAMFDERKARNQPTNRVYVYNTVTNRVTNGSSMLKPKVDPYVIGSVHGKVYVHGSSLHDHDFERFDPELKEWSELPPAPLPSTEELGHASYTNSRPPVKNNIAASAVADHTIILWTFSGCMFSFNINTHVWTEEKSCSSRLPFKGPAVYADGGLCYVPVGNARAEFPLSAFRKKEDPCEFVREASIGNLPPPAGHISHFCQGHVANLGNQHFCLVRSGYDGNPFTYERIPPKHYITIDLFRADVVTRRRRQGLNKFLLFSAIDHHSLSYIMDDNDPNDHARRIRFATPMKIIEQKNGWRSEWVVLVSDTSPLMRE